MDDSGEIRDDIKVPESDVGKDIQSRFDKGDTINVTVLSACGQEMAIAVKGAKE